MGLLLPNPRRFLVINLSSLLPESSVQVHKMKLDVLDFALIELVEKFGSSYCCCTSPQLSITSYFVT